MSAFVIITPSFNQAPFLSKTISSVLSQKHLHQYFIQDGGSTDQTKSLLEKITSKKVSWQSKKDKGQSDAINIILKKLLEDTSLPDSTICAYVNSDDFYLPDAFARVAQALEKSGKQWLVGDAIIVDQTNQPIQQMVRLYKQLARFFLAKWVLAIVNPIPQPATFFTLGAARQVGLFNQKLIFVMDYEYWLRLYDKVGPPEVLHQPLACFRIHGSSKGSTQFEKQFAEQLEIARLYFKNPLALWLQSVHNRLIVWVYNHIK